MRTTAAASPWIPRVISHPAQGSAILGGSLGNGASGRKGQGRDEAGTVEGQTSQSVWFFFHVGPKVRFGGKTIEKTKIL